MRRSKDIWLLVVLFIAFFAGLRSLTHRGPIEENKLCSSYNADPSGTKAFYTLMRERLGFNVERLTRPFQKMPRCAKVLIIVQPTKPAAWTFWHATDPIGSEEESALKKWILAGGTVIFASDLLSTVHHDFPEQDSKSSAIDMLSRTRRLGKGYVYAFDSPKTITNRGMRNYKNAVKMARLVARHATKRDLVLFDEYHHGYGESLSVLALIAPSWKFATVIFAMAAAAALYSSARRFGAVRSDSIGDAPRPGQEFVRAVARLYRRSGANDVAAQILTDSVTNKLYPKLGVSPDLSADVIAAKLQAVFGREPAERFNRIRSRTLAGRKPTAKELLEIARDVQQLEKELGLERIED